MNKMLDNEMFDTGVAYIIDEINRFRRSTVSGGAVDGFLSWLYENNFNNKTFRCLCEYVIGYDNWDFTMEFYGYVHSSFEEFSEDWVHEEEIEEYLKFAEQYVSHL